MVSLDVEGVDFSTMIILQTVDTEGTGLVQTNLGLPLSQSGTLLTQGEAELRPGLSSFSLFFFFLINVSELLSVLRSDFPGVHSGQVCDGVAQKRRPPPLRLQAARRALSAGRHRGVAPAAQGQRAESGGDEDEAGRRGGERSR